MAGITLENVSVAFPLFDADARSMRRFGRSAIGGQVRLGGGTPHVTALSGIDLVLRDGDRLAVVGPNGAGKSTLLRTLAGIYAPREGRRTSTGRIVALLGAHAGFDLDASGLDNILLLGMHLDIPPAEMRPLVDSIVAWAELGAFISAPLRTYSAGMITRLGFAVATARAPEILLMDEWLGLGDAAFQRKAYARMAGFVGAAQILVLASHAPDLLGRWCSEGVALESGRIVARGSVSELLTDTARGVYPSPSAW